MKLVRTPNLPAMLLAIFLVSARLLAAAPASQPPPPEPEVIDLQTAIGYALDNNFAIRQARERIRQQEGVVVEVSARALPNVSADAAYQRNDQDIATSFPGSDQFWQINLTASQALYAGGGIRS